MQWKLKIAEWMIWSDLNNETQKLYIYIRIWMNIQIYSNIFLWILIFIFHLCQLSKPNSIWIFKYFCMNISEHYSLRITWNTGIKGVLFLFLTWRYILRTLLITMIISCFSFLHYKLLKIFEYFELFEYILQHK